MGSRFRVFALAAAIVLSLAAGTVFFPGTASAASCPSVDPTTGAVSPPPAPGVDWAACNLDYANLANADLENANLDEADLYGADLSGADLASAILTGVNLGGYANLSGATLAGADMHGAITSGADLTSADLTNVDLTWASILETSLDKADLAGATLDHLYSRHIAGTPAAIPAGWRLIDGYLVGPTADLYNADLTGADLSGMDLSGATLAGGHFTDANLAGANLHGADLYQTTISGADLSGTDLTGTNLDRVQSGQIRGLPTGLPAPWVLRAGYLLGPGANLTSALLSGLNLTDTNLAGAYFFDARLVNADLAKVDLEGASMLQADLVGSDLFGANVSRVYWRGARCPGGIAETSCARAFDFAGFISPGPGATLRKSAGALTAVFRLYASRQGAPLANLIGGAIATAREVRVTLAGNGIRPVTGGCRWDATHGVFRCHIPIPRHVQTGRSHPYLLTVQEKPDGHFSTAPTARRLTANPATIYFR